METAIEDTMRYAKEHYKPRLIDAALERELGIFGAVSIEGPKWCGKTWAGYRFAKRAISMIDDNTRALAEIEPQRVLRGEGGIPLLIDEWNLVPKIWDAVRYACDFLPTKGNFILTCSTKLSDERRRQEIHHSGAGRIERLKMQTMSLYETGDSSGRAVITGMLAGRQEAVVEPGVGLEKLAGFIIRGGWPANLEITADDAGEIPQSYIRALIENEDETFGEHDAIKLRMLLRSLARNESSVAGDQTIVRDIADNEQGNDALLNRRLVGEYLDDLSRLNILADQPAFAVNYRSSLRIGKSAKHHFADPSVAAALLGMTSAKLMGDLRTFSLLFEALAVHDLQVYMESLRGKVYHFRDNTSGDEVDVILEFANGEYAAVEIKLGFNKFEEAKQNLLKFYEHVEKKPKFMLVLVGAGMGGVVRDPGSGIYISALTALKP